MKKLLDLKYGREERVAHSLARLCYPVALAIEDKQPASALKLLESSSDAEHTLNELLHPYRKCSPEGKLRRARHSAKCVFAILKHLGSDRKKAAASVTAAKEVCERLIAMLDEALAEVSGGEQAAS